VYNVTSGKSAPEWLKEGKKKSLKKNDDYRRRLELVQDFEMPAACQRIKITPDGQYMFASGVHPPQVGGRAAAAGPPGWRGGERSWRQDLVGRRPMSARLLLQLLLPLLHTLHTCHAAGELPEPPLRPPPPRRASARRLSAAAAGPRLRR
jgi:hypothetical protein